MNSNKKINLAEDKRKRRKGQKRMHLKIKVQKMMSLNILRSNNKLNKQLRMIMNRNRKNKNRKNKRNKHLIRNQKEFKIRKRKKIKREKRRKKKNKGS